MKKLILILVLTLATVTITSAEDEYVFTEAQLTSFLQENIQEAVDKVTADLTREWLISDLAKDHQITVLKAVNTDNEAYINTLETKLKWWPLKVTLISSGTLVAGIALGIVTGILAF